MDKEKFEQWHKFTDTVRTKAMELGLTVVFEQDSKMFIDNNKEGRRRIRGLTLPADEETVFDAMERVANA